MFGTTSGCNLDDGPQSVTTLGAAATLSRQTRRTKLHTLYRDERGTARMGMPGGPAASVLERSTVD